METAKRQLKAGLLMNLNNTSTITEDIGRQVGMIAFCMNVYDLLLDANVWPSSNTYRNIYSFGRN